MLDSTLSNSANFELPTHKIASSWIYVLSKLIIIQIASPRPPKFAQRGEPPHATSLRVFLRQRIMQVKGRLAYWWLLPPRPKVFLVGATRL
jgi:hypothetical protein